MAIGMALQADDPSSGESYLCGDGRPNVLVIGGLSFFGRNLISALIKAGYNVHSMAMTVEQRKFLRALGCEKVGCGAPFSFESLRAAARGCLYAVHCASAFVHFDVSRQGIVAKSNALIASNIIRVCKDLRILKLIVQSSEAVLYNGHPIRDADEDYPLPKDPVGSCARSMQEVEDYVLSANSESLETVVIRPRLLWGRGDDAFLPPLLADAQSHKLTLVGGGEFLTSTCHVLNACQGVICALASPRAGGHAFFLTDGRPIVFAKFVRGLLRASGVEDVDEATSRSVPIWVAKGLATVSEKFGEITGLHPAMTHAGIGLIGQEITVVDSKARDVLGYTCVKSVSDGLDEIMAQHTRDMTKRELGQVIGPVALSAVM